MIISKPPNGSPKTAFLYDESFFWHNAGNGVLYEPPSKYLEEKGSVETPASKRRVKNLMERSGLLDELTLVKPIPATESQLEYYHTKAHIQRVKEYSEVGGIDCGDSAIVGKGSYEIAALSAGAAIQAVKAVVENPEIKNAYALTRPPGHHATADEGMGFCIFNNIVIAAKYAQKELGIKKIAIIDWDAHHGNGTEDAFYEDDSVLYISLHQHNLEPIGRGMPEQNGQGKGKGFTLNLPLPAASGDAVYQYAFEKYVAPKIKNFKPDLIMVSAGQDASIFDPLARMMLSTKGYAQLAQAIQTLADELCGGRLVALHEGGYSEEYVPFCTHAIIERLSSIETDVNDPFIYALAGTGYDIVHPYQKEWVDNLETNLNNTGGI
jgi:acetoin utilization deacetylase AcuC-like enzyme